MSEPVGSETQVEVDPQDLGHPESEPSATPSAPPLETGESGGITRPPTPPPPPPLPTERGEEPKKEPQTPPRSISAPSRAQSPVGRAQTRPRLLSQTAVRQLSRAPTPGRAPSGKASPRRTGPSKESSPTALWVVDSHAHLDRLERSLGRTGMECLTAVTGAKPRIPVQVAGGVINYCDPVRFHSIVVPAQQNWRVAAGIHPKHAREVSEDNVAQLGDILKNPAVVGVSEVGLDHSVPATQYKAQTELLQRILSLPHISQKVLIVHLRGNRNDPLGLTVHSKCRQYMQESCGRAQRIHLHCTTTGPDVVREWLRHFPQTHFGFTAMMESFGEQQRQGIREVPLDRLLLETDAPYMPPPSAQGHPSTAAYLGETADLVAKVRGASVRDICTATAANAARLYSLRIGG